MLAIAQLKRANASRKVAFGLFLVRRLFVCLLRFIQAPSRADFGKLLKQEGLGVQLLTLGAHPHDFRRKEIRWQL